MRNLYITPGIDGDKMKEYARQLEAKGHEVTVHYHSAGDQCVLDLLATQQHDVLVKETEHGSE